ncbi:MAG TPA: hypothetical protein PKY82_22205 [Pyrinomonadaceae bacterium]|nr:hypothetical protein [Pyrinomonadaceae bacterium]
MRKIGYNFLLIFGLMITFGLVNSVLADGKTDTKRPKNTGILTVKTTPASYPVLVDGVQVGMSGVGQEAEFYLTPGNHKIEVLGPDGKTWSKEITTEKDRKNCICLKMVENEIRTPCPYNIRVDGPERANDGDIVTFSASNTPTPNSKSNPLKYVWTITPAIAAAKVIRGLGTDKIEIDTTGMGKQTIIASVEVTDGYYDEQCRQIKTVSMDVIPPPITPPDEPVGEMIVFRAFDDIKARVDNYIQELKLSPDSNAYIFYYQGRAKKSADAAKIARRMQDYMVNVRGFDPRRIVMTSGGMREVSQADIFVVKPTNKIPIPTPR